MRSGKILVVDDECRFRALVAEILEAGGYDVRQASCGADAVSLSKASRPDVVVMDVAMPRMHGGETAEKLLQLYPGLPIILMSSDSRSLEGLRKELPLHAALPKPFEVEALLEAVKRATTFSANHQ